MASLELIRDYADMDHMATARDKLRAVAKDLALFKSKAAKLEALAGEKKKGDKAPAAYLQEDSIIMVMSVNSYMHTQSCTRVCFLHHICLFEAGRQGRRQSWPQETIGSGCR